MDNKENRMTNSPEEKIYKNKVNYYNNEYFFIYIIIYYIFVHFSIHFKIGNNYQL